MVQDTPCVTNTRAQASPASPAPMMMTCGVTDMVSAILNRGSDGPQAPRVASSQVAIPSCRQS